MNADMFEGEMFEDAFEDEFDSDAYDEFEDDDAYDALDDPVHPQRRPPAGIIPAGPIDTRVRCQVGIDDFADLSLAVGLLNRAIREFPRRVPVATGLVRSAANRIIARARNYRRQGCTSQNLLALAARVQRLSVPRNLLGLRTRVVGALRAAARARRRP